MEAFYRHRPGRHQRSQTGNAPSAQTPLSPFPDPSRARPLRGRQQRIRAPGAMLEPPGLPPRREDGQRCHHQKRQQKTCLKELPRLGDQDEQRRQREGIEQITGTFQHPRPHHDRSHHGRTDGRGLPSSRCDVEPNQRQGQATAQGTTPTQHTKRLHQQNSDQCNV